MDTYLLLRSNKQSGPYSLQQLVNFGLKPYDLVWVEGKSAAWRYPSEVEGLKDHASSVEEQPYDRFYKKADEKKSEEKPVEKIVPNPVKQVEERPKHDEYILPLENKPVTTTKKVYVSMPENNIQRTAIAKPITTPIEERPKIIEEKKADTRPALFTEDLQAPKSDFVPKAQASVNDRFSSVNDTRSSFKEEASLDEKYSESLEDIKRRYTETYLNRKKKSKWTSTHTSIAQVFGGAVVFCLVVVVLYKNFAGDDKTQSRTTVIQPDRRAINTTAPTDTPATVPLATAETKKKQEKKIVLRKEEADLPDESAYPVATKKKAEQVINENEQAVVQDIPEKKAVMTRKTEEPGAETIKPKTRPININRLVTVKANNYKQRAFGGVLNLELTVNNDSRFELDKVIVELEYLKPSEQPLKTEKIVFNSVEANGSATLRIPDYLRGVKIAYRVLGIESAQYERYTAGL